MRVSQKNRLLGGVLAIALGGWVTSPARASIIIYGGPTYDSATSTGYQNSLLSFKVGYPVGNGTAVGWAEKYDGGTDLGSRAFRIGVGGAVELGHLGTDSSGVEVSQAVGTNVSGASVGYASKHNGNTSLGSRAVRWDPSGATATELGNLGTTSGGTTFSGANAVNAAGTIAGYANKYNGNTDLGFRAVRWSGVAATELGNLGTNSSGSTSASAYAINATGTSVGYATRYNGNTSLGSRAVRWDASGTAATELDNLGPNSGGGTESLAYAVNSAGAAVGYAKKWRSDGGLLGNRPVRWDAGGTAVTELQILGTDPYGAAYGEAYGINDAGAAVGELDDPIGAGGPRPVRWDAAGNVTDLTVNSGGFVTGVAFAINNGGTAAGYAAKDITLPSHALLWRADGLAIDLNSLLSPTDASFWTLEQARGISDTNWVGGIGHYDPDGAGPLPSYLRAYLIDASSSIPEPASLGLLASGCLTLLRRRRVSLAISHEAAAKSVGG
jgi:hypothetical protein